jgi:protease-4
MPPDQNPPPPVYGAPPPVNRPPPVIISPSGARPRKGGGWKTFTIVLIIVLAISLYANIHHVFRDVLGGTKTQGEEGPRLQEAVLKDNDSANKIAVIPIEGVISGDAGNSGYSLVTLVKEQLKLAHQDKSVKAVILKVDSPGGEVLASDEIANAIRSFQNDDGGKPVIVSMGSLAASGGYYVSVPSDWIVANELTITGSIGVIMDGMNYRGLMDKVGIVPEVYKSGKFKDMLSPTKETNEISPEEVEMVQNFIKEAYNKFKGVVQDGREAAFKANPNQHSEEKVSHKLSDDWAEYADGRILSGTQAKDLGFVDEIGDFDVAVNRTLKLASLDKANLVEYQQVFEIGDLLHLLGKTEVPKVKIDWGVDIPKLRPGCRYFLMSAYAK